jgi:hypothetical protein
VQVCKPAGTVKTANAPSIRRNVARPDVWTSRLLFAGIHTWACVLAGTVIARAKRPSFFVQPLRAVPCGIS